MQLCRGRCTNVILKVENDFDKSKNVRVKRLTNLKTLSAAAGAVSAVCVRRCYEYMLWCLFCVFFGVVRLLLCFEYFGLFKCLAFHYFLFSLL